MPLLSIWKSNPSAISAFSIEQIVSVAGNGELKDGNECSEELRNYLAEVPTDTLAKYLDHCLSSSFNKSGLVLQDVVNELGRRLDYEAIYGKYQGTTNAVGFDGIWIGPEGNSLVVEVKTTDAYRISLDKLAKYRRDLIRIDQIAGESSILIVTGRSDTGELEAQIRGSRHAWDIRLLSADALLKLVRIRQNTEGRDTAEKIRRLLVPVEFTKLDGLIDVIFTAARDVETATQTEIAIQPDEKQGDDTASVSSWDFTSPEDLAVKREELISALSQKLNTTFVKYSRALYQDPSRKVRVAVTLSKKYLKKGHSPYWYAYHPQWDRFLEEAPQSYLALGCMDRSIAYALPLSFIRDYLDQLNTSSRDGQVYWHIKLSDTSNGLSLQLPKTNSLTPLKNFEIILSNEKV